MKLLNLTLFASLAICSLICAEEPKVEIDTLGRLTEVKFSDTEKASYVYDPSGNILSVQITTARGTLQNIDTDGDKLPDAWDIQYFGSKNVVSGNTDSDGDGLNDILEYATGHHPKLSGSSSTPTPVELGEEANGDRFLLVQYQRKKNSGVTLNLEASSDLTESSWTNEGGKVEPVGSPVDNGDDTETLTCKCFPVVSESGKVFVRLSVE